MAAAAPPSLPAPAEPPGEAKLRGRRGSRNLLAELAGGHELRWEPVTATRAAFEPPQRKLGVAWSWQVEACWIKNDQDEHELMLQIMSIQWDIVTFCD